LQGKGYFDKYGMTDVEIAKQASTVTRDNLVLFSGGGIDGAHFDSMPLLISLVRLPRVQATRG